MIASFVAGASLVFGLLLLSLIGGFQVLIVGVALLPFFLFAVSVSEEIAQARLKRYFIISLAIKVFYFALLLFLYGDVYREIAPIADSQGYAEKAFWSVEDVQKKTYGVNAGYPSILAWTTSALSLDEGTGYVALVLPNLFCAALLAVFGFTIAKRLTRNASPSVVFWLLTIDPQIGKYSVILMKDIPTAAFVTFAIIVPLGSPRLFSLLRRYALFAALSVMAITFRARALVLIITYWGIAKMKGEDFIKKLIKLASIGLVLLLLLLAVPSSYHTVAAEYGGLFNVGQIVRSVEAVAYAGVADKMVQEGQAGQWTGGGRITQFIAGIPSYPLRVIARVAVGMIIPFPVVQFHKVSEREQWYQLEMDLGAIFWHAFLPFLIYGLFVLLRSKEYEVVLLLGIVLFGMAATGWVDMRWRFMGIAPAYIIIAAGLQYVLRMPSRQGALLLLAAVAYFLLSVSFSVLYT